MEGMAIEMVAGKLIIRKRDSNHLLKRLLFLDVEQTSCV